ncbi:hypothetical protein QT381_01235 [Galbitalea sp. SE-J8]|uniref:hypothetical protein n=1 Tax=Galbitalea sp. SE-J8 TaxID=3054952 RepID=UPI00259D190B|nr:hypothetical protein [Galbitalea sp. SE-J8]MDM4761631.1 hypothetical protein [Galbitalea sp. SE-J8]
MSTQNHPIEPGSADAGLPEQVAGLVRQVRADHLLGSAPDAETTLRDRLADASIALDDDEFARAMAIITA